MKNYADIHASGNDSIALEQKFYLKRETTRGVLAAPIGTDFLFTRTGGAVNFSQPVESSDHRSGRHHLNIIKKKTETSWQFPTYFNIDELLGAPSPGEIDSSVRLLWESLMGKEDITGGSPVYDTTKDPNVTFSIFETGDKWALQASGAFVESGNATFPGDGEAQIEWAGSAKTALTVGIGRSDVDNDGGDTVTLGSGEGDCFPVGAKVMIIKDDGTTRSSDTPDGSPAEVLSVVGDVVTLAGAPVLADANGSITPVYLVYYEPDAATAINNPVTGLIGSITIAGFNLGSCVRNASVNMVNGHELQNFCYGEAGLGGPLFVPGGRFTAEVSLELNLNKELVRFLNKIRDNAGEDIDLILGNAAGRHFKMDLPKVIFSIPEISVPDTGTIPVSFTGNAYATSNATLGDEVVASFL